MTIWQPTLEEQGPVYLAISRALEADIRTGALRDGDRLPPQRALAEALGVNVGTITRAFAVARRQPPTSTWDCSTTSPRPSRSTPYARSRQR